jgi:hypothetical protein
VPRGEPPGLDLSFQLAPAPAWNFYAGVGTSSLCAVFMVYCPLKFELGIRLASWVAIQFSSNYLGPSVSEHGSAYGTTSLGLRLIPFGTGPFIDVGRGEAVQVFDSAEGCPKQITKGFSGGLGWLLLDRVRSENIAIGLEAGSGFFPDKLTSYTPCDNHEKEVSESKPWRRPKLTGLLSVTAYFWL